MAILRTLNEFTRESICMALEPARSCVAGCTYCAFALNSKAQINKRKKSLKDDSTFESTLEHAYSPSYDPTNFSQWALRNRLVLGYANTVEPFQNLDQAISILRTCNQFNIPLFVQTKGVNFIEVVDYLAPFRNNSSMFISIPTLDQRVAKRFEPRTPAIEDRLQMIAALCQMGFYVIAALSPYHEDWCSDPKSFIEALHIRGVREIFFDRLHLNHRQYDTAKDGVMKSLAGGRMKVWPEKALDHLRIIYETTLNLGMDFFCTGFTGTCYGYINTIPCISPDSCFSRGRAWPYFDGRVFEFLEHNFYNPDDDITPVNRDPNFSDSILVTWEDVLAIMESAGSISQPFSYSSLMDIIPIYKKLPDIWKRSIFGQNPLTGSAPMSEIFRGLYNNPYKFQFFARHPWIKFAARPNGVPYTDSAGNLIALFDPDCDESYKAHFRKVESLDTFRRLERDK